MNKEKINELISLYNIPSHSYEEEKITNKVTKLFKKAGCRVTRSSTTSGTNLYITKGKLEEGEYYPCIAAHLDEVHSVQDRGKYSAFYDEESDTIKGYSSTHKKQCGIGADDKNGIWVALQAARKLDKIKVVLFYGEEVGCVGSSCAKMDFFDDCRYVLQVDRKGKSDVVTNISYVDIASQDFIDDLEDISKEYGRQETSGAMTDVLELAEKGIGIACINMSCGYYNPHTAKEFTVVSELQETLDFVLDICTKMTERYEHTYTYSRPYGGYYWGESTNTRWNEDSCNNYYDSYESTDYKYNRREIYYLILGLLYNASIDDIETMKTHVRDIVMSQFYINDSEFDKIFNSVGKYMFQEYWI